MRDTIIQGRGCQSKSCSAKLIPAMETASKKHWIRLTKFLNNILAVSRRQRNGQRLWQRKQETISQEGVMVAMSFTTFARTVIIGLTINESPAAYLAHWRTQRRCSQAAASATNAVLVIANMAERSKMARWYAEILLGTVVWPKGG